MVIFTKMYFFYREFNNKLPASNEKVSETLLEACIKLTDQAPEVEQTSIEALQILLRWPSGKTNSYFVPLYI